MKTKPHTFWIGSVLVCAVVLTAFGQDTESRDVRARAVTLMDKRGIGARLYRSLEGDPTLLLLDRSGGQRVTAATDPAGNLMVILADGKTARMSSR